MKIVLNPSPMDEKILACDNLYKIFQPVSPRKGKSFKTKEIRLKYSNTKN